MLFVSHDTAAVVSLCRSALWLKDSSHARYELGRAEDVCKSYLRDFYQRQVQAGATRIDGEAPAAAVSRPPVPQGEYEADPLPPNVFEISAFNRHSESFGEGGGRFEDACFVDAGGAPVRRLRGGDAVAIRLKVRMSKDIVHPAFGVTIKDRLGQFIFSEGTDNAFRSSQLRFESGDLVTVEFSFRMPELLQGHYSVDIAFAEGLGHDHVQHHWIHEAITFTSLQGRLVQGICGLPDFTVRLRREAAAAPTAA